MHARSDSTQAARCIIGTDISAPTGMSEGGTKVQPKATLLFLEKCSPRLHPVLPTVSEGAPRLREEEGETDVPEEGWATRRRSLSGRSSPPHVVGSDCVIDCADEHGVLMVDNEPHGGFEDVAYSTATTDTLLSPTMGQNSSL